MLQRYYNCSETHNFHESFDRPPISIKFREWLLVEEELEENWKNLAAAATLGLAGLGGGNHWLNAPQVSKDQAAQTWADATPSDTARHTHGGLGRIGPLSAAKIKLSGGAIEQKLAAAKSWAKKHFNVSDQDIKTVKAEDYLKQIWGKDWQTVLSQARQHKGDQPGLPDLSRLDEPIVMVRATDPDSFGENKWQGSCRSWGSGSEWVTVCQANPNVWGATATSREELTHSMQGDVQGQVAGVSKDSHYGYAASTNEFAAKLSELKRQYYDNTGKIANDAKELFDWGIMNFDKLPRSVNTLMYFYAGDDDNSQKIIDYANSILGGLVKTGSGLDVSGLA